MAHQRRLVLRIAAAILTGCLLAAGWVAVHPPLSLTSAVGSVPSSVHLGAASANYVSGDVSRWVVPPTKPGTPRTGVMLGWKGQDPLRGAVTLHYRYLGLSLRLRLQPGPT